MALFTAVEGVEPQSETVWRQADRYGVPRIAFINKMDRVGAEFAKAVEMIRERLGANAVPIQIPIGAEDGFRGIVDLIGMQAMMFEVDGLGAEFSIEAIPGRDRGEEARAARGRLIESLADFDDGIAKKYLEGEAVSARRSWPRSGADPLHEGRSGVCGAAFKNKRHPAAPGRGRRFPPLSCGLAACRGEGKKDAEVLRAASDESLSLCSLSKLSRTPTLGS